MTSTIIPSEDMRRQMEITSDIVCHPRFAQEDGKRYKKCLSSSLFDPLTLAGRPMHSELFAVRTSELH